VKLVGRREIFVRDRVQVLAESLQPRHDSRQKSARLVVTKHFLVRLAHGRKSCADFGEPSIERSLPPPRHLPSSGRRGFLSGGAGGAFALVLERQAVEQHEADHGFAARAQHLLDAHHEATRCRRRCALDRQVPLQYVPAPVTSCPHPSAHGLGSARASRRVGLQVELTRLARADRTDDDRERDAAAWAPERLACLRELFACHQPMLARIGTGRRGFGPHHATVRPFRANLATVRPVAAWPA
jgi:hypothetical protein